MNAARPLHSSVYHQAHISRGRCHDNTRRHAVRAILANTMYVTRINPWARPDVGRSGEHVKAAPAFNQRSVRMRWDRPANPMRASMTFRLRKGGGRSFQHRVAANLKEPRNAMERCLGVAKMCVQALLDPTSHGPDWPNTLERSSSDLSEKAWEPSLLRTNIRPRLVQEYLHCCLRHSSRAR
ncbi:uncharacterized protein LOC135087367 isoform X1 [Ostrinia nubilalis]|uniref:uncharacterized protein LOC135087367 isoform X1 n=1 Tax=Ostrinia nubilalis TaxID=29057 RepID=UPI003082336A